MEENETLDERLAREAKENNVKVRSKVSRAIKDAISVLQVSPIANETDKIVNVADLLLKNGFK